MICFNLFGTTPAMTLTHIDVIDLTASATPTLLPIMCIWRFSDLATLFTLASIPIMYILFGIHIDGSTPDASTTVPLMKPK